MNVADFIEERLNRAACKIIEGRRCFIVNRQDFRDIVQMLGNNIESPASIVAFPLAKHQLECFVYTASSFDKETYFICTKGEPTLDTLWEKKGPKE